jgi:Uma2 family endonuclease
MNAIIETNKSQTLPKSNNGKAEIYYPETNENIMPENDFHFTVIANLVILLRQFLLNNKNSYVFGDLMFYYEEGNPRKFVAPDVMVCFGIDKTPRKTYKLWTEKVVPSVIIEIASESTWDKDLTSKLAIYQRLGVSEYYIFDVEYRCLRRPLMAFRLVDFVYEEVDVENNSVFSPSLNLELVDTDETLRLFNPETNKFLMTQEELSLKQQELEKEMSELRAEIERLKQTK